MKSRRAQNAEAPDAAVAMDSLDLPDQIAQHRKALTVAEIGDILGLSSKQIYALVAKGYIPSYRIAGSIRFDPKLTAEWLRSQTAA
jgi:excisionase family DNA binding protein